MTTRSRSAAAQAGWETRRRNAARERERFLKRSAAAKRGWETRRRTTGGEGALLPVYRAEMIGRGLELGHARTLERAEEIAEDRAEFDEELVSVVHDRIIRAYIATYKRELEDVNFSEEWEIGFEYRGADRGSHVDVNIRIERNDGAAFGPREAQRVLKGFRDNLGRDAANPVPAGYSMAFIDWRRPRWGTEWQSGDEGDIVSFHAPMYVESANESVWSIVPTGNVRLGSIKRRNEQ